MQTTICTKIFLTILLILLSLGVKESNQNLDVAQYFEYLGAIVFLIMIASLRMSLIGFYQGSNLFLNQLTPNKLVDDEYKKLIKWNIKLFFFSQIPLFDQKYQKYCSEDIEMYRYLNYMLIRNEREDEYNKRKLFLAFYSINLCIEMATWGIILVIIKYFIRCFG